MRGKEAKEVGAVAEVAEVAAEVGWEEGVARKTSMTTKKTKKQYVL